MAGQTGLVAIGDAAEEIITLTEGAIIDFARQTGDQNPIHLDPAYAAGTRFGRLIACGGQVVALYMGMIATTFSQNGAMLGLEMTYRFPAPSYPDEPLLMKLEVVAVEFHPKLKGDLTSIKGGVFKADGKPVLLAEGKVLVLEKL